MPQTWRNIKAPEFLRLQPGNVLFFKRPADTREPVKATVTTTIKGGSMVVLDTAYKFQYVLDAGQNGIFKAGATVVVEPKELWVYSKLWKCPACDLSTNLACCPQCGAPPTT